MNRLDVRRSLAQYSAAEADLRLEIAKQYPDVQVGPGYTYEEKNNFFTIGLSVTLPLFNRNQGPIAEAESRRKEAGAAFKVTQPQVIAQSERGYAVYSAALKELTEADQSLWSLSPIAGGDGRTGKSSRSERSGAGARRWTLSPS